MSKEIVRDENGTFVGTNELRKDWWGNEYITHDDAEGNRVGTSELRKDWLGNEYITHDDAEGNRVGTSEVHSDFWGDYYVKTDMKEDMFTGSSNEGEISGSATSGDGPGVLSAIFSTIVVLAVAIGKAVWWIYYKFFSFLGPLPIILFGTTFAPVGAVAIAVPPFAVFLSIAIVSYFPALIALIVLRLRKKITTDNMRKTGALWCVIGPFACIYLVRAIKKNVSLK